MKASNYGDSYEGLVKERKQSRIALLFLSFALLVCTFIIWTKDRIVTMVPPGLEGQGDISSSTASPAVKEAWASYVAELVGNATPNSVDFVTNTMGRLIDPRAYKDLIAAIKAQADLIKEEQVTVQFVPSSRFYVPDDDYVAVSGEYTVRGLRDTVRSTVRTFEIGLQVHNYAVSVTSLDVYDGPWRPRATRRQEQSRAATQPASK